MQELVGRLTALDPEATETLKVIAYFDALVNGHATTEVLLRGAAILSGCAAGFAAEGVHLRVDSAGVRAPAPRGDWPFRRFGDDGIAWIERTDAPHANDDMILERLALALGIALDRTSPTAASRRALQTVVDREASAESRLDAARRLNLDPHGAYRVIATTSAAPPPSVVIGTDAGPVRVIVRADEPALEQAGIGLATAPDALPRSFASALVALRLTTAREPVLRADDLGALLALGEVASPDIPDVAALSALDPRTLHLLDLIASTDSLRAAGVEAGLHHSTVQAKAAHYSDALGYDVRTPSGRVRLSLALALHRLVTTRF